MPVHWLRPATLFAGKYLIERDKLGIYNGFLTAMGKSARRHPDKLLAAALVAGFTTPCYTGKNFFDADHEPQKGKGKFTNKGTKKLSAANYAAAVATLLRVSGPADRKSTTSELQSLRRIAVGGLGV